MMHTLFDIFYVYFFFKDFLNDTFISFCDKRNQAVNTCAIYFKTGVSFEHPNTVAFANPTPLREFLEIAERYIKVQPVCTFSYSAILSSDDNVRLSESRTQVSQPRLRLMSCANQISDCVRETTALTQATREFGLFGVQILKRQRDLESRGDKLDRLLSVSNPNWIYRFLFVPP